jgi:ABC-type multidrug transport system fused ATPase/permease subunit
MFKNTIFTVRTARQITAADLSTLGINEKKFAQLTPKEQKQFLQLHALEETSILKARSRRKRPDLSIKRKTSFRYILAYLWAPYGGRFIFSVFLSILQSVLYMGLPLMVRQSLNDLVQTQNLTLVLTDFGLTILILVVYAGVMYVKIYLNAWIGVNIIKDLRDDMFRQIQIANSTFLDLNQTGDLLARNTSDINLLKNVLASQLALFIRQTLTFGLAVGVMFYINWKITLFALLPVPIIFIVMFFYRRKMFPLFHSSREIYGNLTSEVQENITGMRVVRAFAQEDKEIEKFKKWNESYYNEFQKLIRLDASFEPIIRLFANVSTIFIILIGGQLSSINPLAFGIGDFFSMIILVNFSIEPLFFISRFLADMAKVNATCDRVVDILLNKRKEPDTSSIVTDENTACKVPDIPTIKGVVKFDHVFFSYRGDDHYELKDISFETKSGEKIAILGATGSGKSTIIRLIPRFYEISKGVISIDGIDIRNVNIHSLRKQIGLVPQESFLFGRTILENLRLGRADAPMDEVYRATKLAKIHDYIDSLPEKYETIIGERGVTLSGGQKQRMSMARALIIQPRILIFDDATSSVDVDTEFEIQQSFKEMFQESTTFIITQRLSTVRNADRIIVLNHGQIAEIGTHQNLVDKPNGIYSKLYHTLKVEERASWD